MAETATPYPLDVSRGRSKSLARAAVKLIGRMPIYVILGLVGVMWLVPTFGLLVTSLLSPSEAASGGWWEVFATPSKLTFENYQALFDNEQMMTSILTTAWISIGSTLLPIAFAASAAYALAWLEFWGRDVLYLAIIGLMIMPLQMALIPIFSLYNFVGLFDTVLGLVLFHTAFAMPFAVFLLRNFFTTIPRDLIEAARIDGASELRVFARVVLPLGLPAIASFAIFQFLWVWNDLLVALTLAQDTQPLTVAIFSQFSQFGTNIGIIAPATFLSLVVPLVVFFAFQRYFVEGLLAGSVR